MIKDVFISHSSEDSKVAQDICTILERRNIKCWIAPRNVTPGKSFGEEIVDAIEETYATILILSENSNKSTYVRNEVERAVAKGKPIFPVRVRNVLPSKGLELYISSSNWVDAWEPPIEQKANQLADAINVVLSRTKSEIVEQNGSISDNEKSPNKKPVMISSIIRPKWFAYIALIIVVVVVLLLLWLSHERKPSVGLSQINTVKDTLHAFPNQDVTKSNDTGKTHNDSVKVDTSETTVKKNAILAKAALTELVQFWAEELENASTQDEKAKVRLDFGNKFKKFSSLPPELMQDYIDYMLHERKFLTEQEYVVEVINSAKDIAKVNAGIKWLKEKALKEMINER